MIFLVVIDLGRYQHDEGVAGGFHIDASGHHLVVGSAPVHVVYAVVKGVLTIVGHEIADVVAVVVAIDVGTHDPAADVEVWSLDFVDFSDDD